MRRSLLGLLLLVGVLAALVSLTRTGRHPASPTATAAAPTETEDALVLLNQASRAAYSQARREALARSGPIVIVSGDALILRHGEQRSEVLAVPTRFHTLKSISHIPLALHALLVYSAGDRLTAEKVQALRHYREQIVRAEPLLGRQELDDADLARQRRILADCLLFLDGAIEKRQCSTEQLTAFCRRMRPLVLENATEAARAQIQGLQTCMDHWRQTMKPEDWRRLTVVVQGSQLPRKDNLVVQYFARLLGENGEGPRIVYAEAIFDEERALNLLGTRILDRQIGVDFFDDPERMYRDLLGDAARAILGTR